MGVISTEPWRSWCALQTPVPDQLATTGWSCVSARSSTVDDDGHCLLVSATSSEPLPEMLCFGCHSHSAFCECNATECAPQLNQEPTFELSLSADGNALTGTYQEFVGAPVASGLRLYLERVATEP